MSAPEGYIVKAEAAKVMGCSNRTIDNLMKRRMIPFYKFGYRVFLKREDVLAAVNNHRIEEGTKHFEPVKQWDSVDAWEVVIANLVRIKDQAKDPKHQQLAKDTLGFITKLV